MERLKQIGIIPINQGILYSLYSDLKYPANKISDLKRDGLIVGVKQGLYIVSPKVHNQKISSELVANHLYNLSYVSLESALAYYGLIPERVYLMRSVCTKMRKQYDTPLGNFEYVKVPENYFPIGIRQEIIGNSYAFLIASPEKALCDMILTTPNLRLQSVKAMREYLVEDLRVDFSAVEHWDTEIVRKCVEVGKKQGELKLLGKILENNKHADNADF